MADQVRGILVLVDRELNTSVAEKRAVQTPFTRKQEITPSPSHKSLMSDPLGHGSLELLQEKMAHTRFASLVDMKMT